MMKIILTIATLLLSTLSFAQTQTKILQIDIRGRSCSGGLGLCSNGESEYKKFTVIKQQQNEIILEIKTDNITPEEQKIFFGGNFSGKNSNEIMFFSQNEDYAFSKETALLLDLNPKYMILKKGNYKTRIVKDNIQIILNLSDK